MLLAPFLWIFCEFDEKVLDNLSLEKQKSLCHKRQREKKKLMRYFEVFLFLFPTLFPTCYN